LRGRRIISALGQQAAICSIPAHRSIPVWLRDFRTGWHPLDFWPPTTALPRLAHHLSFLKGKRSRIHRETGPRQPWSRRAENFSQPRLSER